MACSKLGVATHAFVAVLLSLARAYQLAVDVNRDSSRGWRVLRRAGLVIGDGRPRIPARPACPASIPAAPHGSLHLPACPAPFGARGPSTMSSEQRTATHSGEHSLDPPWAGDAPSLLPSLAPCPAPSYPTPRSPTIPFIILNAKRGARQKWWFRPTPLSVLVRTGTEKYGCVFYV